MSVTETPATRPRWATASGIRALFRERPVVPLLGLLAILIIVSEVIRPGIVSLNWAGVMVRAAVPLAILAACQTMTMLTGGIDLSVGAVASMSGFLVATLVADTGLPVAILIAFVVCSVVGLVNGVGAGVFRVHPLIMTLAMSLVVLGLANVWQLIRVQTGSGVPPGFRQLGANLVFGFIPVSLFLFIPLAILVTFLLNRTGFGRLLYAIGDNPVASRLSGAKSWQVLIVLYILSSILAGTAGFLYSGLTNVASVTLADSAVLPSVAAAVIGGTSILGGRGGYSGTMIGALILAVISSILSSLGYPEAVRQILFGTMIVLVAGAYTRITSD